MQHMGSILTPSSCFSGCPSLTRRVARSYSLGVATHVIPQVKTHSEDRRALTRFRPHTRRCRSLSLNPPSLVQYSTGQRVTSLFQRRTFNFYFRLLIHLSALSIATKCRCFGKNPLSHGDFMSKICWMLIKMKL